MPSVAARWRCRQCRKPQTGSTIKATRSTSAPSLNVKVDKSGICVHVKTIRLNGPSVILPSADCRLLYRRTNQVFCSLYNLCKGHGIIAKTFTIA